MNKKKFITCAKCEHYYNCPSGQLRMKAVDPNSPAYQDIGCFGHEQYLIATQDRQLKLF